MEKLEAYGFVKPIDAGLPVYSSQTKYLQFAYASENCRASLRTHGNVLEVFAYHTIRQMNIFDDVKLSVKIRWDKDVHQETETENEIDLICTKGTKSYFISCKKKNSVDMSCLTEIRYESDRFGVDGTPILLTTAKRDKNLSTYNRAAQMGIPVIVLCDYMGNRKTMEDSGAVLRKELLMILGD